ncbi:unnamed protein product [Ectocarpus sp. 12 AP-2014]
MSMNSPTRGSCWSGVRLHTRLVVVAQASPLAGLHSPSSPASKPLALLPKKGCYCWLLQLLPLPFALYVACCCSGTCCCCCTAVVPAGSTTDRSRGRFPTFARLPLSPLHRTPLLLEPSVMNNSRGGDPQPSPSSFPLSLFLSLSLTLTPACCLLAGRSPDFL